MRYPSIIAIAGFVALLSLDSAANSQEVREEAFRIDWKGAKQSRSGSFVWYAPPGWRICHATTNEWSAVPKGHQGGGPTSYRLTEKMPTSATIAVSQPCPNGSFDSETISDLLGQAEEAKTGADSGQSGLIWQRVMGNTCVGFGGRTWLNLTYHFRIVPVKSCSCPEPASGHVMPWEPFPKPASCD